MSMASEVYWNPEFKNWNVFETFKDTVLAELGQIAAGH